MICIDMDMPDCCGNCNYVRATEDRRHYCILLDITFPPEVVSRFALCPLKECEQYGRNAL